MGPDQHTHPTVASILWLVNGGVVTRCSVRNKVDKVVRLADGGVDGVVVVAVRWLCRCYSCGSGGGVGGDVGGDGVEFGRMAGDGVAGIKRRCRDLYSDGVRNFATASGRGRLKEDLESSTWGRCQDYKATISL
ncbi:hypothetical protein Tco_1295181 [Tanacetum coccineum]